MNLRQELNTALVASNNAAKIIEEGFDGVRKIYEKGKKGIVTEIDLKSESIILDTLKKNSEYPVLSEEEQAEINNDTYWIVDPLDGTTNYARKIPLIGISIALIERNKIKVGVVQNPMTNECFSAGQGLGAFRNGEKIHVSDINSLKPSIIFLNNGYDETSINACSQLTSLLASRCSVRKFGTSALELCYVAKGSADAFLCSGDELWDYAAGLIIVQEAGGLVTDWKGKECDNSSSFIFASNKNLHEKLLQYSNDLQK